MVKAPKKKAAGAKPGRAKKGAAPAKAAAAEAPKGGPTADARAISKANFDKFIRSYRALKNDAAEAAGNVGGLVSNYTENHKLHKKAFALIKTLDRLRENPVGLAELLFHFDVMREHGGYDKIAATDMLPDRSPEANVRNKRSGKDAAAEQGAEDADETAGDGETVAKDMTEFGDPEAEAGTFQSVGRANPFREVAQAGDDTIAENVRRTH